MYISLGEAPKGVMLPLTDIYTYHPDYTTRLPTTSPQGPVGPLLDWAGTEEMLMMADAQICGWLSLAEEDHVEEGATPGGHLK
jgi:hypothetical protein